MRIVLATAGATLALVAPAQAAYAPKVQLSITPTTQSAAPAVTSVITQADGETANRTVVVTFPKGFQPNFGNKAQKCTSDQENANACPASSQIGDAAATASVAGLPVQLTGAVFFGGPITASKFRLIVFLHNDLTGDQKIIGTAELVASGGARTTFDNLPNTLTTMFKLVLDGGDKGLLKNPNTCGAYDVTASFTSQSGEQASASQPVTITGCKPIPLAFSGLSINRTRVRFDTNAPGTVTVTIKRNKKKIASGTFTLAKASTAVVKTPRLKPGKYVIAIALKASDGRTLNKRYTRNVH